MDSVILGNSTGNTNSMNSVSQSVNSSLLWTSSTYFQNQSEFKRNIRHADRLLSVNLGPISSRTKYAHQSTIKLDRSSSKSRQNSKFIIKRKKRCSDENIIEKNVLCQEECKRTGSENANSKRIIVLQKKGDKYQLPTHSQLKMGRRKRIRANYKKSISHETNP